MRGARAAGRCELISSLDGRRTMRTLNALLGAAAIAARPLVLPAGALAQAPEGDIDLTIGAGAGSGPDLLSRKIADILNSEGIVENPIVVNNRTGGSWTVAATLRHRARRQPEPAVRDEPDRVRHAGRAGRAEFLRADHAARRAAAPGSPRRSGRELALQLADGSRSRPRSRKNIRSPWPALTSAPPTTSSRR